MLQNFPEELYKSSTVYLLEDSSDENTVCWIYVFAFSSERVLCRHDVLRGDVILHILECYVLTVKHSLCEFPFIDVLCCFACDQTQLKPKSSACTPYENYRAKVPTNPSLVGWFLGKS